MAYGKSEAIEHYEKSLTPWRDADPSLAEVEDARAKLELLKGQLAVQVFIMVLSCILCFA